MPRPMIRKPKPHISWSAKRLRYWDPREFTGYADVHAFIAWRAGLEIRGYEGWPQTSTKV